MPDKCLTRQTDKFNMDDIEVTNPRRMYLERGQNVVNGDEVCLRSLPVEFISDRNRSQSPCGGGLQSLSEILPKECLSK
jgi:hypothetical protein